MNRRIADAEAWAETEIEARADDLANRILARWPWDDPAADARPDRRLSHSAEYRWKLDDGPEHVDVGTSQFTLNVTAALLDLDPENAKRLSGSAITADIHPGSRYPPGQKAGPITMLAIPRHGDWVMNAYRNQEHAVEHCRKFARRCGKALHVERTSQPAAHERFWTAFENADKPLAETRDGNTPKRRRVTRTGPHNTDGDRIAITVERDEIRLQIEPGTAETETGTLQRIAAVNRRLDAEMSDQSRKPTDDHSAPRAAVIYTPVDLESESEWSEAAEWIRNQHARLIEILNPMKNTTS